MGYDQALNLMVVLCLLERERRYVIHGLGGLYLCPLSFHKEEKFSCAISAGCQSGLNHQRSHNPNFLEGLCLGKTVPEVLSMAPRAQAEGR